MGPQLTMALGLVGAAVVIVSTLWLLLRRPGAAAPDWHQVELDTAAWLDRIGCRRVELTGGGADGGIDVLTERWAVQVKATSKVAGRPTVQQTVTAALAVEREPAVVSASGFSPQAVEAALRHDVALVDASGGTFTRVNDLARQLGRRRRRGFAERLAGLVGR